MSKIYLSGKNSVIDAIKNNYPIEKLIIAKGKKIEIKNNLKIEYHDYKFLNELVQTNHQGFIAQIKEINFKNIEQLISTSEPVIILDHLQDPQNVGSILRSANAFGYKNIIIPKNRSVTINETVLKVSSGGFVNMNFHMSNSLISDIEKMKKAGYWIYATNLSAKSMDISKVNFDQKSVIIIGNEEKGVNHTLLKNSDVEFSIETIGTVQSLNVSNASSIIFYHLYNFLKK
ncbi:23S rRNA (guanosine2251-2'-O)-methyltransferase [Mycoplasma testudineum]|uniref:23S rRNA (Guanosine2251-2'-O)-methyltransferase n=1 Tax=Mycoplasma testudineum TaxID=244584 RepID=A0A4R6IBD4_9MOLU|nr:23S rRNA (guanosine(2251)-2'-O)-methyltransferase RlmB [Mycoplasma testudineum]OYD26547.1 23S rRNA (guanosine(2251)-2'-O)-methyltransferase RlmB [Mycoplasma testudineum]TDO19114.1 23S rRNA (guanosine2251-2'-O)-methyltransferase [Mycoplasma testudineum]